MKTRVMDDFRILKELEKLAEKAIGVLKRSKEIRSCFEAGELRKSLRGILARKEEKLEETLMKELLAVLGEVAEFLKDSERSFKSGKFKKLGDEISGFLEKSRMKDATK